MKMRQVYLELTFDGSICKGNELQAANTDKPISPKSSQ